ncbi:hypothetical protein [Methanobrevibacter curvatus]|uniref:Uncharacterized protein n=1 Tax=Methanobrevibacter curvatus TaxID=49547 RepID=A0A166CAR9_9EURY|nr:hypothetical protein [Methanobrevibacter curvatus]KZX14310.1 hypothetical protein MBCUR_05340 [Methanobrevibacter curvatus]
MSVITVISTIAGLLASLKIISKYTNILGDKFSNYVGDNINISKLDPDSPLSSLHKDFNDTCTLLSEHIKIDKEFQANMIKSVELLRHDSCVNSIRNEMLALMALNSHPDLINERLVKYRELGRNGYIEDKIKEYTKNYEVKKIL